MTAMTGGADCPSADLIVTRASLHRVAENVLAAVRYAGTGEFGARLATLSDPAELDDPGSLSCRIAPGDDHARAGTVVA